MKTLAAKLRRHASEVLDPGYPYYGTPELVRKAADEIDRLRAENQLLRAGDDAVAAMAELWETREKILFDITDAFTRARWLPVSERMPADKEYVLTFSISDHNGYIEMRVQQRRDGEWDYDEMEPSHWMPLPAPPTDGK